MRSTSRSRSCARIERDLHDGAQARLVALGMSLGMAEQKLASDPAAAQELLAEARQGAREALEELRDLARGIHPPVLADRGLEAAIAALADRTPLRVDVVVDVPRAAAARGRERRVLRRRRGARERRQARRMRSTSTSTCASDGGDLVVSRSSTTAAGGADPAGSGLRGLARRVEALDGTLEVIEPGRRPDDGAGR